MSIEDKAVKEAFFEIEPYDALPCEARVFTINGKDADLYDFGDYEHGDYDECDDEDICRWGCFEKYFVAFPYSENEKAAKKYNLTKEDYDKIISELEDKFAIGTCGWCI